jgi:hypothetical protein
MYTVSHYMLPPQCVGCMRDAVFACGVFRGAWLSTNFTVVTPADSALPPSPHMRPVVMAVTDPSLGARGGVTAFVVVIAMVMVSASIPMIPVIVIVGLYMIGLFIFILLAQGVANASPETKRKLTEFREALRFRAG